MWNAFLNVNLRPITVNELVLSYLVYNFLNKKITCFLQTCIRRRYGVNIIAETAPNCMKSPELDPLNVYCMQTLTASSMTFSVNMEVMFTYSFTSLRSSLQALHLVSGLIACKYDTLF